MYINRLVKNTSDNGYFEHNFIVMLESHMTTLRTSENLTPINVTSQQNYKYVGDLYGLLTELGIDLKYHYITSRFNGYKNSNDFKGDKEVLILPDFSQIELLKTLQQTKINF